MEPSTAAATPHSPQVLRVLLDTNVMLDWLLDRKPWSDEAAPIWQARDTGRLIAYLPASALTDIYYIARRQIGADNALAAVDRSLALEIIPVDKPTVLRLTNQLYYAPESSQEETLKTMSS